MRAVLVAGAVTPVPGALLRAGWWDRRDVPFESQSGECPMPPATALVSLRGAALTISSAREGNAWM